MNPTITKLKQSYERLQASFTMQNKLDFDQVVWSCLPELWKVTEPLVEVTRKNGRTKYDKPLQRLIQEIVNSVGKPMTKQMLYKELKSKGYTFTEATIREALRFCKNMRVYYKSDGCYLDLFGHSVTSLAILFPDGVQPKVSVKKVTTAAKPKKYIRSIPTKRTPPKPIKPSVTTPFIQWFESNYELADGFTPIFDLIKQCPHTISEDRAKDQLKSKGYLVYNRPTGGCVQARPIKKQKSEFVNLTEVLKEMK